MDDYKNENVRRQESLKVSKTVVYDVENSIILGDYLDILLNKNTNSDCLANVSAGPHVRHTHIQSLRDVTNSTSKLCQYEFIMYADKSSPQSAGGNFPPSFLYSGGIRLPHPGNHGEMDEGSGNFVISGKPGVGKSTMAFQFAAACASQLNRGISIYFSLDTNEKHLVKTMRREGGNLHINYLCVFPEKDDNDLSSDEDLEQTFRKSLRRDLNGRIIPQMILPKLSPRGISMDREAADDTVFIQRIEELQTLLRAVSMYNQSMLKKDFSEREPMVKLVVIDSLDVFGEMPLKREEINRLFMLFKLYGIIGVFTMGSIGYDASSSDSSYKAAVAHQSDVVIELKKEIFNNYSCSYFEIVKSRYTQHVLGHHPYKIDNYRTLSSTGREEQFSIEDSNLTKRVVVLPSLHFRIGASENSVLAAWPKPNHSSEESVPKPFEKTIFGIDEMIDIMPNHFKERNMNFPQIITISGDSGLYKSDLALNALIAGIVDFHENGLIVRLGDRDAFTIRGVRFEEKLWRRTCREYGEKDGKESGEENRELNFYEKGKSIIQNKEPHKYTLKGWSLGKKSPTPQILEVTFKNGALLPEEFVDEICEIINRYKIRRVAFIDLKYIGSSYPFLANSDTSGDLFLSTFIHIMRNYGMHVIMSSSLSQLDSSDRELKKAGILADAILTCSAKWKNGKCKSTNLTGEGLITSQKKAVIKTEESNPENSCIIRFCPQNSDKNESVEIPFGHNQLTLSPFSIKLKPTKAKSKRKKEDKTRENSKFCDK